MKISKHIAVILAATMAYTPMAADSMAYSGKDIYTRSIEISKDMNSVSNVVLVNGEKNIDSLSGSVLANSKNASMLLIKKDYISPETLNEIKRINPEKIYIFLEEQKLYFQRFSRSLTKTIRQKEYGVRTDTKHHRKYAKTYSMSSRFPKWQ